MDLLVTTMSVTTRSQRGGFYLALLLRFGVVHMVNTASQRRMHQHAKRRRNHENVAGHVHLETNQIRASLQFVSAGLR